MSALPHFACSSQPSRVGQNVDCAQHFSLSRLRCRSPAGRVAVLTFTSLFRGLPVIWWLGQHAKCGRTTEPGQSQRRPRLLAGTLRNGYALRHAPVLCGLLLRGWFAVRPPAPRQASREKHQGPRQHSKQGRQTVPNHVHKGRRSLAPAVRLGQARGDLLGIGGSTVIGPGCTDQSSQHVRMAAGRGLPVRAGRSAPTRP